MLGLVKLFQNDTDEVEFNKFSEVVSMFFMNIVLIYYIPSTFMNLSKH